MTLRWTTEQPQRAGYYWARWDFRPPADLPQERTVIIVEVDMTRAGWRIANPLRGERPLLKPTLWAGPIDPPEEVS